MYNVHIHVGLNGILARFGTIEWLDEDITKYMYKIFHTLYSRLLTLLYNWWVHYNPTADIKSLHYKY